jgi:dephospho-CoA kinase
MKVIGITGGIATGVTTVAQMFRELGAVVVEADVIARQVVLPGTEAHRKIIEVFGKKVLNRDGTLNRKELAARIFKDETGRRRLNAITHPHIRERIQAEVARVRQTHPDALVVIDLPLLLDTTGPEAFDLDGVIVVAASREAQISRLRARDKLSKDEIERRLAAQRPVSEKEVEADWVIDNSVSLEETRRQVEGLWQDLLLKHH